MQTMPVNEQVTVGPQPNNDDLERLGREGYKSVVNFRTEGEEDQPLSPQAEGDQVRSANMDYVHLPVTPESMNPQLVDDFRQRYQQLPKPVFAHCSTGKRAGAMVMMHVASEQGMSGEETVKKAQEMGFECEQPELVEFVKSYVDTHGK